MKRDAVVAQTRAFERAQVGLCNVTRTYKEFQNKPLGVDFLEDEFRALGRLHPDPAFVGIPTIELQRAASQTFS